LLALIVNVACLPYRMPHLQQTPSTDRIILTGLNSEHLRFVFWRLTGCGC